MITTTTAATGHGAISPNGTSDNAFPYGQSLQAQFNPTKPGQHSHRNFPPGNVECL